MPSFKSSQIYELVSVFLNGPGTKVAGYNGKVPFV